MSDFENFAPIAFEEVDPSVPYESQLRSGYRGEVTLIGTYVFATDVALEGFLTTFPAHADFMKSKPGFQSAQLHRGIDGARVLIIYADWDSPAAFHAAFAAEEALLAERQAKHIQNNPSTPPAIIGRRVLVEKIFERYSL